MCAELYMAASICEELCIPANILWFGAPVVMWVKEPQLDQAVTVVDWSLLILKLTDIA